MGICFAAYRIKEQYKKYTTTTDGINNYKNQGFSIKDGMSDAELNSVGFDDAHTAKQNTTNLINSKYSPAAEFCRNQKINGYPCDFPNIQEMKRIWILRDYINFLDPTVSQYPDNKLGASTEPVFGWTSTSFNDRWAWFCRKDGSFNVLQDYEKTTKMFVIPVLEL